MYSIIYIAASLSMLHVSTSHCAMHNLRPVCSCCTFTLCRKCKGYVWWGNADVSTQRDQRQPLHSYRCWVSREPIFRRRWPKGKSLILEWHFMSASSESWWQLSSLSLSPFLSFFSLSLSSPPSLLSSPLLASSLSPGASETGVSPPLSTRWTDNLWRHGRSRDDRVWRNTWRRRRAQRSLRWEWRWGLWRRSKGWMCTSIKLMSLCIIIL